MWWKTHSHQLQFCSIQEFLTAEAVLSTWIVSVVIYAGKCSISEWENGNKTQLTTAINLPVVVSIVRRTGKGKSSGDCWLQFSWWTTLPSLLWLGVKLASMIRLPAMTVGVGFFFGLLYWFLFAWDLRIATQLHAGILQDVRIQLFILLLDMLNEKASGRGPP